jgi:hypothetical protein
MLVAPLRTLHELLIYFAVTHPRAAPESSIVLAHPVRWARHPPGV